MKLAILLLAALAVTSSADPYTYRDENESDRIDTPMEDIKVDPSELPTVFPPSNYDDDNENESDRVDPPDEEGLQWKIRYPSRYIPGRTYIYHYDAQILTGVPQTDSHYTGFKLRAAVWLAIRKDREVDMQMRWVDIQKTNGPLPVALPVVPVPIRFFSRIYPANVEKEMKIVLRLPIRFKWHINGTVDGVMLQRGDPHWSANIKKAIMSMLSVNMKIRVRDVMQSNGIWKEMAQFEEGIEGRCQSKYSYSRFPYTVKGAHHNNRNLITIVKNRDLHNCSVYPWLTHNLFIQKECKEARRPITAQAETRYNASKSGINFFLRQISTVSQSVYMPESRDAGSIATFVVQRLLFVRHNRRIDIKLPKGEGQLHKKGLMMVLPIQEMSLIKADSAALKAWARQFIKLMIINYRKDNMAINDHMRFFIETTRKMSANDIKEVVLPMLQQNQPAVIREMMLELLPKIATKQAIDVITEWIVKKELLDNETSVLVSRLGAMSFVSHDIMVRKLMMTVNQMRSKDQWQTYKSLILTVGQLINTRYTHPVPSQWQSRHPLISRRYIRAFYERLLHKNSPILPKKEKQMIVILSLGNCRLIDPCLDILEDMVPAQKRIDRSVRIKAVFALSMMAPEAPLRIRKLVMPIYTDIRENAELRLASYLVFIRTRPTRSDMRIITQSLIKEPSQQVRSFVQSHLKALGGMSGDRCMSGLALNVSRVEEDILLPEEFGEQYSQVHSKSIKSIREMLVGWLSNRRGFMPRTAGIQLIIQALGLDIELMQAGIDAVDLQQMLDPLLGPDGTLRLLNETESIADLLKPLKGNSKMNIDFTSILTLYEGFYGLSGLSMEAIRLLRKGWIPLPQTLYKLVTKGGRCNVTMQHTLYIDSLNRMPTPFGIPFSVNHTITGHVKIDANITLKPNLFAKVVGAAANITHRGSIRHQLRVGVDLGALSTFVEANLQAHVPRSRINTIKVAIDKRRDPIQRIRINIERPLDDSKIAHLSNSLHGVQKFFVRYIGWWKNPIRHRSLPQPRWQQNQLVSLPSIGLGLRVDKLLLNSTGIADFTKLPFHGPAELKVIIERNVTVGGYRSIDINCVVRQAKSSIKDIMDKLFETEDDVKDMDLSQTEQDKLIDDVGRIKRRIFAVDIRLRNMTIEPLTAIEDNEERIPPIGYLLVHLSTHSRLRGLALSALARKVESEPWEWSMYLMRHVSNIMQQPRFDKEDPLKILKDAKVITWLRLRRNRRTVMRSMAIQSVGEFWINVIERIKRNPRKVLLNIPDLQQCAKDIGRRPDSPACLQAWRDINAMSRMKILTDVYAQAPHLLKRLPLAVHNMLRLWLRDAHVSSNLTKLDTPSVQKLRLDLQLSPYNTSVFTAWVAAMDIVDRFVNARSLISLKNSLTQLPKQNILENVFGGFYPATCHVVSSRWRTQVRTFDGVDYHVRNPLRPNKGGRIVLVQDIKERLQVSEQRSRHHRVTFIRLKEKADRVLIVTDERSSGQVPPPRVMYKGRWQSLPFELRNTDKKVILRAVRDPTARSLMSITVHLPTLGSLVRTHPLIATDIVLDPFFHSTVRGICGDFDGEKRDELKGPMCRNVYRRLESFVNRYTTITNKLPFLRQLEIMPSMTRFMRTKQCPRGRYYPIVL